MVISRSETVLILKGKAGEMVITRVISPRKGRAALGRAKTEAEKEKLKARLLVSGQHTVLNLHFQLLPVSCFWLIICVISLGYH